MSKQIACKWNLGLIGVCILLLMGGEAAYAQDLLSISSVTADRGAPTLIPVHLIDNKRTTLGTDRLGFDRLIQAFAIQIQAEPKQHVQSIALEFPQQHYAASALLYSAFRAVDNKAGLVALHSHSAMILDYSGTGRDIAMVNLVVSPSAPVGSTITLSFVPANTLVSNQAGTLHESAAAGGLAFQSGIVTVSNAPVKTTLSITATKPQATERGGRIGRIQIKRVGDLRKMLVAKLNITGNAEPGRDYVTLPPAVTFKKGKSVINLTVKPIDDSLNERKERVIVALSRSKAYRLQKPSRAIVLITDND